MKKLVKEFLITIGFLSIATVIGMLLIYIGFTESNVTMVYLLCVLLISIFTNGYIWSVAGSLVSVVLMNFFLTEPRFTLHTYDTGYPLTCVIMLAASMLTGTLASKLKKHVRMSEQAAYREKTLQLRANLLRTISHDLRTPLTMITAYSEVMRDLPGENTPENVQVIIDETKRLTFLVNDLLDMSKIQAGVTTLETKEYDLSESINAAIERHSKLLEPYGYKVIFKYDRHVLVEADEFKIYQVIYNLIGNAVNYTGEDKKVIINQIVENGNVRIQVIDSGEGIPKDKLENVWDRYYKIDKEHKRAIMGSGLGLSIVQNILKLHNAKYGVESEEGIGSTFWFELPVTSEVNIAVKYTI